MGLQHVCGSYKTLISPVRQTQLSYQFWHSKNLIHFDPYEYHMDLGDKLCLSSMVKTFNVGHYMQTFQPIFFTPAMLIGTIDLYHFIPLLLTLALPGQCKAKPLGFIFSHTFHLIRMKFDLLLKQFKLNIQILFLSEI